MTFKKISLFFIAALTTCSIQAQQVQLIPEPSSLQIGNGSFKLPNAISIQVSSSFEEIGKSIHTRLNAVTGKKATLSNQKNATFRFEQVQDNTLGKEGYQLTVNEKGILVKAQTYAGALYAWQSILQLCPPAIYGNQIDKQVNWAIPYVQISDVPRFEWRGFMLDVSRHFFTVSEVKKMLDEMAMYKLNRLHFHLTDDN